MTAQDQQSRAEFEAIHAERYTQPLTRWGDTYANAHVRCRWEGWQAARALPPGVEQPIARLREITKGIDADECADPQGWWETGTGAEFGSKKLAELEALVRGLIELPAGVEPVGSVYTMQALVPGGREVAHVSLRQPLPAGTVLYTAAQVLAMGRVPECPVPCGWDALHKLAVGDGAYLTRVDWPEDEEGVSVQRAVVMRTVTNLIDVCRAMLASAPKPPAP